MKISISGPGGKTIIDKPGSYVIGRFDDGYAGIFGEPPRVLARDTAISRSHAELLVRDPNSPILSDKTSRNGTYVDGIRITAKVMEPGIEYIIKMGDSEFTFKYER